MNPLVRFRNLPKGQRRLAARRHWLDVATKWAAVAWAAEEPYDDPNELPCFTGPEDWGWCLDLPDSGFLYVGEPDGRGRPWRIEVLEGDCAEGVARTLPLARAAAVGAARAFVARMATALGGRVQWQDMPPVAEPPTTNDPAAEAAGPFAS